MSLLGLIKRERMTTAGNHSQESTILENTLTSSLEPADATIARMEGWLYAMWRQEYQRRCHTAIGPIMSSYLRRARTGDPKTVANQLSDAFEDGRINLRQYQSASMTDIVAYGYCRQRQRIVQVAVEASIRLNRRDIDRAGSAPTFSPP